MWILAHVAGATGFTLVAYVAVGVGVGVAASYVIVKVANHLLSSDKGSRGHPAEGTSDVASTHQSDSYFTRIIDYIRSCLPTFLVGEPTKARAKPYDPVLMQAALDRYNADEAERKKLQEECINKNKRIAELEERVRKSEQPTIASSTVPAVKPVAAVTSKAVKLVASDVTTVFMKTPELIESRFLHEGDGWCNQFVSLTLQEQNNIRRAYLKYSLSSDKAISKEIWEDFAFHILDLKDVTRDICYRTQLPTWKQWKNLLVSSARKGPICGTEIWKGLKKHIQSKSAVPYEIENLLVEIHQCMQAQIAVHGPAKSESMTNELMMLYFENPVRFKITFWDEVLVPACREGMKYYSDDFKRTWSPKLPVVAPAVVKMISEADLKVTEGKAREAAERQAAEAKAREAAERQAAEAKARTEAERKVAEETARAKDEASQKVFLEWKQLRAQEDDLRDKVLEELRSDCSDNEVISKVATLLIKNSHIKTLDLTDWKWEARDILLIGPVLQSNCSLTKLDLTGMPLGLEGAIAIAEALKKNRTLTTLNLYKTDLGSSLGVTALAEALKINQTLTDINLGHTDLGDEGATKIAKALEINISLTEIDLTCCFLGRKGYAAIAEALKTNRTLINVSIPPSPMGGLFIDALKLNPALTQLNFGGNEYFNREAQPYLKRNLKLKRQGCTALLALRKYQNGFWSTPPKDVFEMILKSAYPDIVSRKPVNVPTRSAPTRPEEESCYWDFTSLVDRANSI